VETQLGVIINDIKKLWEGLEFTQKFVIMILLVFSVAAITYIGIKSSEPEWGVLYSDLSESDASGVAESLKKSGYPFKFSDDRKTVLVPLKIKEDLRIKIAEEDIIQDSNPGFELLNKMQFGATDFQNKLTRQKIFQDELTRTIEKIKGVQKARVQIAEPDRSVFSDRDELPSASVMLILDVGYRLKPDQVKAIKNIVAYGVPRLTQERVFLTDQTGAALSDDAEKNPTGEDDYKTTFEKDTAKKVQKVLQNIVGLGNVTVEVSANINFDRTKTTIEKYLPASDKNGTPIGVLSNAKEEIETYDNGKKTANETETTETPEDTAATQTNSDKSYEKSRSSREYNVSKEISQVVYAPGKVERMTIAVALNKILTTKEKEEIKNLVASASGADETRGDTITITGMQFAVNPEEQENQIMNQLQNNSSTEFWIKNIAPLVVILILGLGGLFVLSSLLKKPVQGEVYDSNEFYSDNEQLDSEEGSYLPAGEMIPALETSLDPVMDKMKEDINATIMGNPSEAARLLQAFIKD